MLFHEEIGGFDIPVDNIIFMSVLECHGGIANKPYDERNILASEFPEGGPFNELHGDVVMFSEDAHLIDRNDMGVVKTSDHPGFALEELDVDLLFVLEEF